MKRVAILRTSLVYVNVPSRLIKTKYDDCEPLNDSDTVDVLDYCYERGVMPPLDAGMIIEDDTTVSFEALPKEVKQ
jgi:hypothetical protein